MSARLSQQYLKEALDYNPATGLFTWKLRQERTNQWNSRYAGKNAGSVGATNRYLRIFIDGKLCYGHRLAWLYMTGEQPPRYIDHANGDRADNRWSNLRACTQSQNNMNSIVQRNNKMGLKGVSRKDGRRKKPWFSRIKVSGRVKYLGSFSTPEEAAQAYREAEKKYFGDFAPTD